MYFHCSYVYNYYNYLEPCALNAEFQHIIPRFNKTSLLCGPPSKRVVKGGERKGEDRVTLRKTLLFIGNCDSVVDVTYVIHLPSSSSHYLGNWVKHS
jgi:hypothetical protein